MFHYGRKNDEAENNRRTWRQWVGMVSWLMTVTDRGKKLMQRVTSQRPVA